MDKQNRRWYLTLIAATYLLFCSTACLYYVSLHFQADAPTVSWTVQLTCLGLAIAAGTYFIRPRLGHLALLALTVLTLFFLQTTDPKASAFHAVVLGILLMPFVFRRTSENPR